MPGQYHRLLDGRTLTANLTQDREQVVDFGAFRELNIHIRILRAGSDGDIVLQHAAVKEDAAFADLAGASAALEGGSVFVQVTAFLRYIRWTTNSSVAGSPAVIIEVVAKS